MDRVKKLAIRAFRNEGGAWASCEDFTRAEVRKGVGCYLFASWCPYFRSMINSGYSFWVDFFRDVGSGIAVFLSVS